MRNRTLISPYTNVYMNLALEQHLARNLKQDERILLFWTDTPSIVFGRFQNPWSECRTELLAGAGVLAARRYSGGGTVFHDPGNLNYSVITDRKTLDIAGNLEILKNTVARQGAEACIGPRRDLLIGSRKISGSAFQLHRDFAIHHGTLLVNSDLEGLVRLLGSDLDISQNQGVASVKSPVANLGSLTGLTAVPHWIQKLQEGFGAAWGGFSGAPPLPDISLLTPESQVLSRWEWIYGQTPPFVLRLLTPRPLRLRIEGGRIAAVLPRDGPVKGIFPPDSLFRADYIEPHETAALLTAPHGTPADMLIAQLRLKEEHHAI